ncbi:unnamed protein product [Rhizoctonia solani]|uniref:Zn(2)-C6 fungal-type domain-containing protein n=1 Tax=Rhizoctonia solani TaxID=456999 RepID=A0A8H3BHI2_9AGAM|nr:unnamed protein product [Rhizoctonia solani]
MDGKRASGPLPLSCITCRERRKKCDRRHPTCNRCKAGGFTCLGYASRTIGPTTVVSRSILQDQITRPFDPNASPCSRRSSGSTPTTHTINTPQSPKVASTVYDIHDALSQMQTTIVLPWQPPIPSIISSLTGSFDDSGSFVGRTFLLGSCTSTGSTEETQVNEFSAEHSLNNYQLGANSYSPDHDPAWPPCLNNTSTLEQAEKIYPDLTIYINPDTSAVAVEYITSQYERAYSLMSFELTNRQESFVRSCVLAAITVSKSACWSLFIGAKIYEVAMSDYHTILSKQYIKTLDKFEQQLTSVDRNGMPMRELVGWLFAASELFELRFLIDPRLAYKTAALAVPIFLNILELEPSTWHTPTGVFAPSLHGLLVSSQAGMSRFVISDVIMSFLIGFPQFIHWDTRFLPELAHFDWEEWIPPCPVIFILVIAKVNAWRHRDPSIRDPEEWRLCERDIREWRSDCRVRDPEQSWQIIGRLGTQEALRHMVLIYLYMGMCSLKSGDHRVQASCKQIVQICSLAKANPDMSTHMYISALVAGICAINERHRSILFQCLQQGEKCRSFLFGTAGFTAAIEHLWCGAGSNGAQVTWDDYLESCDAAVGMER